jgi:transcriptional regulator with XRE-family HTH domain
MIKNDNQLTETIRQLRELEQYAESLEEQYSGAELRLMLAGIERQLQDIKREVDEYQELRQLTLEEAVSGRLQRGTHVEQLGDLLARLRVAAGLTQSQLAERLGWHQSNVSRFESENYSSQTLVKIVEYASALNVWLYVLPSLSDGVEFAPRGAARGEYRQIARYSSLAETVSFELREFDIESDYADDSSYWKIVSREEPMTDYAEKVMA